jgi:hypothetical protein
VETPRKFITWCFHKQNYYIFYRHANIQRTEKYLFFCAKSYRVNINSVYKLSIFYGFYTVKKWYRETSQEGH